MRRKLIDDLENGSKIFVYRVPDRVLAPDELRRLRRAMESYGDNTLLYVRLAKPSHPPGTVEQVEDGLMVGYIDRFEVKPDGALTAPNPAGWLAVCERAHELWSARFLKLAS
jgi:hypothetical protein